MFVRYKKVKELQVKNLKPSEIQKETNYSINTIKKYLKMDGFERQLMVGKISNFDVTNSDTIVKSVGDNQQELINDIIKLYVDDGFFDADFTYSKGKFYSKGIVHQPRLKFDVNPQYEDVQPLTEAEKLNNSSLKSVIVDLPFLVMKKQWHSQSLVADRFTAFESEEDLNEANKQIMNLAYSKLANNGILVMKTMNTSHDGKQLWITPYIFKLGFSIVDEFILVARNKVLGTGVNSKILIQRHARKYHSYFYVLKK